MARSYTKKHIDVIGKIEISVSDDIPSILWTFELLNYFSIFFKVYINDLYVYFELGQHKKNKDSIYVGDKNMETKSREIKRKMKSMKVNSGAGSGVFMTGH